MNTETQNSVHVADNDGQQRQAHKPHDRTRTAPKPKQAKRVRSFQHSKGGSATKTGPGRRHVGGKPGTRIGKPREIRAYVALGAAWAAKRITKADMRDEHGAFTLVGKSYELERVHPSSREVVIEGWVDGDDFGYLVARKWLAGISAQRGF